MILKKCKDKEVYLVSQEKFLKPIDRGWSHSLELTNHSPEHIAQWPIRSHHVDHVFTKCAINATITQWRQAASRLCEVDRIEKVVNLTRWRIIYRDKTVHLSRKCLQPPTDLKRWTRGEVTFYNEQISLVGRPRPPGWGFCNELQTWAVVAGDKVMNSSLFSELIMGLKLLKNSYSMLIWLIIWWSISIYYSDDLFTYM